MDINTLLATINIIKVNNVFLAPFSSLKHQLPTDLNEGKHVKHEASQLDLLILLLMLIISQASTTHLDEKVLSTLFCIQAHKQSYLVNVTIPVYTWV